MTESKFQGVSSSREIDFEEDRNEEKSQFSAAREIEKKIV